MAFCPKCGTKIEEGTRFCTGCGTPVTAQQQAAMPSQAPQYTQPTPGVSGGATPVKKKNIPLLIVAGVVVLVILIIIASVFSNSPEQPQQQNTSIEAFIASGGDALSRGDYDRAIAVYTQAIRLYPNFSGLYGLRGMAYYYKGDFDSVIADCTEAIRLNWDSIEYNALRAHAYFSKGDFLHARFDVNWVLQFSPYDEEMRRYDAQLRQMGY